MAQLLPALGNSPFRELGACNGPGGSGSSHGSAASIRTVQHRRLRSLSSGSSISSLTSLWAPPFRRHEDSQSASRSSSAHNLGPHTISPGPDRRSISGNGYSRRTSFATALNSRLRTETTHGTEQNESRLLDVVETEHESSQAKLKENDSPEFRKSATSFHGHPSQAPDQDCLALPASDTLDSSARAMGSTGPLRWLSTLRRRKQHCAPTTTPVAQRFVLDDFDSEPSFQRVRQTPQHQKSDSWTSSLGLITAVKSASVTVASASIATLSRKNTNRRRGHQRSSVLSGSEARQSMDSQRSIVDQAAQQRSRSRREKLEELIKTEEGYVADVKALSDVHTKLILPRWSDCH